MMEPYRIKVMDNINDKINRLFKIKQLEYQRDDLKSVDVASVDFDGRAAKNVKLFKITCKISKLLEDE